MSINDIARKFEVRNVLKKDAWYLEITNDLRVMIVTEGVFEFEPIAEIKSITEDRLSVTTDSGKEYDLEFKNLQLLNLPNIKAIRSISGIIEPAKSEPILLALYDLSGIIYREIHLFGAEVLQPEKIVRDFDEICEVHDRDVLMQAASYILKSQKQ